MTFGNNNNPQKEPVSRVKIGIGGKFIERSLTIPERGNRDNLTSLKHNENSSKLEVVTDIATKLDLDPGRYTLTEIIDHLGNHVPINIPDKLFVSTCADGRPIPKLSVYQNSKLVDRFFVPDRNANVAYNEEAVIQTFVRDTVFQVDKHQYTIGGKYPTVNMHPAFADEELYPTETTSLGNISDFSKKRLLVWLKLTSMQIQSKPALDYDGSANSLISTCIHKMGAVDEYNSLFDNMTFNKDTIPDILFMFNYLTFQNNLSGFNYELTTNFFQDLCVFYDLGKTNEEGQLEVTEIFQAAIDFMSADTDGTKIGGSSPPGGAAAIVTGAAAGFAVTVAASVAGAFLV